MKKRIYVVTTGYYSDYSIRGVFSSKTKAKQYMRNCKKAKDCCYGTDFNDIEEWELDDALNERPYKEYKAVLVLDTGEEVVNPARTIIHVFGIPHNDIEISKTDPNYGKRTVVIAYSYKSFNHARKLAVEARQKWLRELK